MEKLIKTSRIINKLLTVFLVLAIIVGVFLTYTAAITALKLSDFQETFTVISFKLGNVELFLQDDYLPENFHVMYFYSVAIAVLSTISGCYMILLLKRIFKPMELGLPFDSSVGISLKRLAWCVLIFGFLYAVLNAAMETAYFHILDLGTLMVGERIKSVELNVVTDGSFIIVFVILLLLSHVFRYGAQLQQLSDETL